MRAPQPAAGLHACVVPPRWVTAQSPRYNKNALPQMAAMDLFVVPTIGFNLLTPHSIARLSISTSSHYSLSSAAFITNIAESDFRHAQGHYYCPPGLPRHQQPWLATVRRTG